MTQLGFDNLLTAAAEENRNREFARETAHLPGAMIDAIPFYRDLIQQHHAAVIAADTGKVMQFRREAKRLALRLNNGDPGILAHEDAPGYALTRETAAPSGTVPLWGQEGEFEITVGPMRVRIMLDGMFGIASSAAFWPGFAAHAVDLDRPFLSETGYRSFLGIYAEPAPGLTPDAFTAKVIAAYVEQGLKGRLRPIAPQYRTRRGGAA